MIRLRACLILIHVADGNTHVMANIRGASPAAIVNLCAKARINQTRSYRRICKADMRLMDPEWFDATPGTHIDQARCY
jgi:hypothetical protein